MLAGRVSRAWLVRMTLAELAATVVTTAGGNGPTTLNLYAAYSRAFLAARPAARDALRPQPAR